MLGLLLFVVWLSFAGFVYWQIWILPDVDSQKFQSQQWVLLVAAVAATSGWIVTSWINVRNSIKQHTITTLLQTRLSIEYMKNANVVGGHYRAFSLSQAAGNPDGKSPTDGLDEDALQYILNYFEFIALGIRAGDLHEGVLKDSLRSIIARNINMSKDWIDSCRAQTPRLYENLGWLNKRWSPEAKQIERHNKTRW